MDSLARCGGDWVIINQRGLLRPLRAVLTRADGQRVVEHVARIPARLDLLELRVVVLIIDRVPGDARGIPRRKFLMG